MSDVPFPSRRAVGANRLLLASVLLVWAVVAAPLVLGWRTFFQRDVFAVHLHLKWVGAAALRAGEVPAFNAQWALGQPYRGNPNALAFYPGNLLYLVLPFWSAFNLHFALHWLLAFFTMRALARELGQSEHSALLAGITYAGSGWLLSGLTFYNILGVAAWWPLVLVGAARGGVRGWALGGSAAGMAFLCGEPVTAALGLVPLLLMAVERQGWRRGVVAATTIVSIGALISLPQIVATLRVLTFTLRGTGGLAPSTAYILHPVRLLELLVPLPFGSPIEMGDEGYLRQRFGDREPFFYSLHFGVIGAWLAASALRSRRTWAALAAAGLLVALLGGVLGPAIEFLTRGTFRYPEKFLFWFALATPLLAGWGLERVAHGRVAKRSALVVAAVCALGASTVAAWSPAAVQWLTRGEVAAPSSAAHRAHAWAFSLAAAALLALLAAWAGRRRGLVALSALQVLALLQLAPLVQSEPTEIYRRTPPFAQELPSGSSVAMSTLDSSFGTARPVYRLPTASWREFWRIGHLDLDYPTGIVQGLRYPFPTDFDGLISPLHSLLLGRLPALGWPERVRWMRIAGLDAVTLVGEEAITGLRRVATVDRFGVPTSLYRVEAPLPQVWWPRAVETVPSQLETMRRLESLDDPLSVAYVARAVDHRPGGQVHLVGGSDPLEVEVTSPGGVFVVGRSYQPLLAARSEEVRLATFPADVILTAVEVPAGRHRVVLESSATPELIAGAIAIATLAAALCVLGKTSRAPPNPPGMSRLARSRARYDVNSSVRSAS